VLAAHFDFRPKAFIQHWETLPRSALSNQRY